MTFKKNNPGCHAAGGCKCGPGCEPIATDNFNRANSSNINTGAPFTWSGDTSGLWILGSQLVFFATVFGRIKCGTAHPTSSSSGVVYATFGLNTDGDIVEVWLNGTDADNCTVARLTYHSLAATLDIRTRIANVDVVICSTTLTPGGGGSYTLWLKYDEESGKAEATFVDVGSVTYLCTPPYPCGAIAPIGDFAGIAVDDHADSDIFVDDFFFYPLGDGANGCPEIPCPDNDPCAIYADDFDRANNADISANTPCTGWTEVSGTWAIASNTLQCTSAGIVLCNAPHPGGTEQVVEVQYSRSGSNRALIIVGWLNSSNYTYLQYVATGILLRQVVGGVDTQLHSNAFSSASGGTANVCINENGDLTASFNGVAQFVYPALTLAGSQVGLGAELSGTVTFDNFTFKRSYSEANPTCPVCGTAYPDNCSDCCPGAVSRHLTFYWPGGLSSLGGCFECNQLTSAQEFDLAPTSSCSWQYLGGTANVDCGSDGTTVGAGGDCCSIDPDSVSLHITATALVDTTTSPFTCFYRVVVRLFTCPCPSLNGRRMVTVSYQTSPSAGLLGVLCDGIERDLEQHNEASTGTSYRGNTGWLDGYHGGCAGTLPTTPTIRA